MSNNNKKKKFRLLLIMIVACLQVVGVGITDELEVGLVVGEFFLVR